MEGKFQTTFIPKKGPTPNVVGRPVYSTNYLAVIANVIFTASIFIALGMFGYKYYITNQNKVTHTKLDAALTKFEKPLVDELTRLDDRIESSKTLLNNHLALSAFFSFLSQSTIKTVQFINFKYKIDPTTKQITVMMDGQAQSFAAVALQSDEFMKPENQRYLSSPVFSGLTLNDRGYVKFTFSGVLNQDVLLYKTTIKGGTVSLPVVATTTKASTTSTTR